MSQISAYALIRRVSTLIHADTHIVQDTRINTSPREFAIASAVPVCYAHRLTCLLCNIQINSATENLLASCVALVSFC